jgi:hypothetical protein
MKDIYVKFKVQGALSEDEANWARGIAIKANSDLCKIMNTIFIPVYNKVWRLLYPNTKDWDEEHPNYIKMYVRISDFIANLSVGIHGGHKKSKRVRLNTNYDMYRVDDERNLWKSDNFIFIDRR